MITLPGAFEPLAQYRQFILWKSIPQSDGSVKKLPVNPHTLQVFTKGDNWQENPATWINARAAIQLAQLSGDDHGVGFFFTANDPFYFLDIDKCNVNGEWSETALTVLKYLPGAAVEISQSGAGLHVIGSGVCPEHGCKNIGLGLELYTKKRFVALTGVSAMGSASADGTASLPALVTNYFPLSVAVASAEWTTAPVTEWTGQTDDDKLIAAALKSKSAAATFGGKASFADLWTRNVSVLSDAYPADASDTGSYDESSADAGLAQHLLFWTGKDCARVQRLMERSGLVRDKWKRTDYLMRTITRANSLQGTVYTGGKSKEPERVPVTPANTIGSIAGPEITSGYQFLGISEQIEHFAGCVYIQSIHKIFIPTGAMLKQDQFNATYGGYIFALDTENNGKTTRKAWEAFTESQAVRYPKAEVTCFRPENEPGALVVQDGRVMVNTYVPVITPRMKGDATPFLNHLAKVLPEEQDRDILLAYMAACIQHKGVKFQWAPLLQGVEGNGKTLFTRVIVAAIGDIYVHMPRADEISEKFNDWLFYTLFVGVEDIYVPDHKREVMEVIKPMITNERQACRAMQTAQVMKDVRCNFMFNTNLKTGLRKTENDRRFCVFYTAQQKASDLERDGMAGDYFPDLYKWLNQDGYAVVADYLDSYAIPKQLNPATSCQRAPRTTSTAEAVTASLGGIEQEVLEAIDEGRQGFAGGWVSSMAFEKLLEQQRATKAIPINRRREILQSLGYDWHPGLKNGRVNSIIMLDNGKPRLFIKTGHIHANLESATEITRHYLEAQGVPAATGGHLPGFKKLPG